MRPAKRSRVAALVCFLSVSLFAGCGESLEPSSESSESAARSPGAAVPYNQTRLPFGAAPLSARQRNQLLSRGKTLVSVRTPARGTVSAVGQAQDGLSVVKVARAAPVRSRDAGVVRLEVRLTGVGRGLIRQGDLESMYLAIRFSGSATQQQLLVPLGQ